MRTSKPWPSSSSSTTPRASRPGAWRSQTQTRPGARGALLVRSCVAPSEFGGPWPDGVPLQIHMMDADEWALPPNEDLDAAHALERTVEGAELFVYPGDRHLFADESLAGYDAGAATLLERRVLGFLEARSTPEA